MGREVRRVPADWAHPCNEQGKYKPLFPGEDYADAAYDFLEKANTDGLQCAIDKYGEAPDLKDYMPNWPVAQRTHYMMYEDATEGTPLSPAFATPEALAQWLVETGANAFAGQPASYEAWMRIARGGWAPSMVFDKQGLRLGAESMLGRDTASEDIGQ